ncbi:ADP-ribosylglycohydrolase family protein [Myroides fluvii]|uniref:ADP-ribosylglycohydrolase family protein n=1 Tax=Myroides fluvii TaxID=2572594 RepID=UPI001E321971|nr:ADP-ribosylglycohydrolase family protein [Myroides fluvii]
METVNQPSKKDTQNELVDEDYLMNILSGDIEVKSVEQAKPIVEEKEEPLIHEEVTKIKEKKPKKEIATTKYQELFVLTKDAQLAYENLIQDLASIYQENEYFNRIFFPSFKEIDSSEFNNRGFVVGSLEIALQTILTTKSYEEAILKVMSLGKDTDTNGAITGALAGILYGFESIPKHWIEPLKRKENILALAKQLQRAY